MTSLVFYITFCGLGCLVLKALKQDDGPITLFIAEGFFVGAIMIVIAINLLQVLGISIGSSYLFWAAFCFSLVLIFLFLLSKKKVIVKGVKNFDIRQVKTIYWFCLLIILLQLLYVYLQLSCLPLLPWDAWSVWVAKSKIWYFLGIDQSIVNESQWLNSANSFANEAAHYPEGLSIIYWFLSGFNGWEETQLNQVYFGLYFSLILLVFGYLHKHTNFNYAVAGSLLLSTLPLLKTHIILAGYADIWIAALLSLLLFKIQDVIHQRRKVDILFLGLILSSLFLFKLESYLWLLALIITIQFYFWNQFRYFLAILVALLVATYCFILVSSSELELGFLKIGANYFQIGDSQPILIEFQSSISQWLESFFNSRNWNLLWFSIPFVFYINFKESLAKRTSFFFIFSLVSLGILFLIFNFTSLSLFAQSLTALNRIVLQIVPIYIVLLIQSVYLFRQEPK